MTKTTTTEPRPKCERHARLTISVSYEPDREAMLCALMILLDIPIAERERILTERRREIAAGESAADS